MIVDKEWINNFPKWINENGCWLPERHQPKGYVQVGIRGKYYLLHRLTICAYHGIDYYDEKIVTRHKNGCNVKCFSPEHLSYGSQSDNINDSVRDGTNYNSNKEYCPKCGGPYYSITLTSGRDKGKIRRKCRECHKKLLKSSYSMRAFLKRLKRKSESR